MDLPTVVGQQTLYYIEVSLSFTYFLSLPLLKSYRKLLSFQPVATGWVGKSRFAMLPVRVYCLLNLAISLSYVLLQKFIVSAHDCEILKDAVNERRKEMWTICVEVLALILSFIPRIHYVSCPLLVVAMAPWIIPDLSMVI